MTSTPAIATTRLLLVDDDDLLRGVMAYELRKLGYAVNEACRGADALALIQAAPCGHFDCVVMDYRLDFGETGDEVVDAIRTECPDQLVLYLTGHILPQDLLRPAAFLQKPAMPEQVAEAVERLMRSKRDTLPPGGP